MVIVAELVAGGVPSTVVAVRVMFADGALAGAVYVVVTPLAVVAGETEPHSTTVQGMLFKVSVQSTLPFCCSYNTVAMKFFEPFNPTKAELWDRPTAIAGSVTLRLSCTSGEVTGGLPESVT